MSLTGRILILSILLMTAVLTLHWGINGLWVWVAPTISLGGVWLFSLRRDDWGWFPSFALALFLIGAVGGLWAGFGAGWMLLVVVAALSAWDLDRFHRRLQEVEQVEQRSVLERRHLLRLLIVIGLGALLAGVALLIQLDYGFCWACLLGLLVTVGLSQAIQFLRQEIVTDLETEEETAEGETEEPWWRRRLDRIVKRL